MKHAHGILFALVLCISLIACTNSPPPTRSGTETRGVVADTGAQDPTDAPPATPTPRPTRTPAPKRTPTTEPEQSNIATVIADPGPDFANAWIYGVAHLDNGYFLVTLDVPGGVDGSYQAKLGEIEFNCMTLEAYPSRLYCTGLTSQAGEFVDLKVFALGSEEPVFETVLGIPPVPLTEAQRDKLARVPSDSSAPPPVSDMPDEPYPDPYPYP